jgi:hypothetical protein
MSPQISAHERELYSPILHISSLRPCIGVLAGLVFQLVSDDQTFVNLTKSSPDFLLAIFLPALIFESAYRIEYHALIKDICCQLIDE